MNPHIPMNEPVVINRMADEQLERIYREFFVQQCDARADENAIQRALMRLNRGREKVEALRKTLLEAVGNR